MAALFGGGAFFLSLAWLQPWAATALAGGLTGLTAALRFLQGSWFDGVEGSRAHQRGAEVTFGLAGTAALLLGWALLGDKALAASAMAFLVVGDNAAGLVRALWPGANRAVPAMVMGTLCLAAGMVLLPWGQAILAATTATLVERYRLLIPARLDDNLAVVATPLLAVAGARAVGL